MRTRRVCGLDEEGLRGENFGYNVYTFMAWVETLMFLPIAAVGVKVAVIYVVGIIFVLTSIS